MDKPDARSFQMSLSSGADAEQDKKIYSVSELTRLIKTLLEREIGEVWIEGELSNVRRPPSGHCYFTIKDELAQIGAVLFRGNQTGLKFEPKDGLQVRVFGEITVYERGGNYQIIVRRMQEWGKGALLAKFEAMKEKLQKEGLFDAARKKPIPVLPRHIGIVTSPTGAAIRDMLSVIGRRFPNLHVLLAPVRVQGEGAAEEIAAAINTLNACGGLDVLIVGRGGGSIEDLWCFNEELVARAIAASGIPVISAVGHEIDFTISDFVADLRAPTPSAAAELVVESKEAFEEKLAELARRLARSGRESALRARNRLLAAQGSYVFREPRNMVKQWLQKSDTFRMRMAHAMEGGLREKQQRLDDFALKAAHAVRLRYEAGAQDVKRLGMQLNALNPLAVLRRGYSVTSDENGRIVKSARSLRARQRVSTRLAEGSFESEVTETDERAEHDGKSGDR